MDFEIGTWKSSKQTDNLNEKLFGQGKTKLNKFDKPLSGALAREEELSMLRKRKKKKKKLADSDSSPKKSKPKTKEEAIALRKAKKHQARKKKQNLNRHQAKVNRRAEAESSDGDSPSTKEKLKNIKSAPKTKRTVKSKKGKAPVVVEKPKKNTRNKYKNLALQKKGELNPENAKFVEVNKPDTKFIVNGGSATKAKYQKFSEDDDDDDEMPMDYEDISEAKSKKSPKKKKTQYDSSGTSSEEDSDDFPRKKGAKNDSSIEGARAVMKTLKHKKSENSDLIKADNRKVEIIDLQEPSNKKKKKNVTYDSSGETSLKKTKQHKEIDLVNSTFKKSSHKDKFNLAKLQTVLQHDTTEKATKQKKGKESLESNTPKSLKSKMLDQLNAARFRFINEQLYTSTSEEAVAMMSEDPEAFNVYHQGFQSQVSKWPSNPLDLMISYLKKRPKSLIVADLGCGDGLLAESVNQTVHSFDLVSKKKEIIACDIANVPLKDRTVDVSIFCLSLMGTNLADFICEANRITKTGGILLIAEVLSRFEKLSDFIRKMGKLGYTLLNKDESNKMFVWLEFKKTGLPDMDRLPKLELAPCSYKKR